MPDLPSSSSAICSDLAMTPNPAFEGTAHLRGVARRWVPSALRASATPQRGR
jgi:hypothetical protein